MPSSLGALFGNVRHYQKKEIVPTCPKCHQSKEVELIEDRDSYRGMYICRACAYIFQAPSVVKHDCQRPIHFAVKIFPPDCLECQAVALSRSVEQGVFDALTLCRGCHVDPLLEKIRSLEEEEEKKRNTEAEP